MSPKSAKPKSTISTGDTNQKNKLFYGDNLEVLRKYIKDETIDLCYIDPPFNSNRTYNQIYNNIGEEDRAQAQAFVDTWTWDTAAETGFDEIVSNPHKLFSRQTTLLILGLESIIGRSDLLAYLVSITLRCAEIYRVLKPTGSFYLHCDPTASHYLKLVLDSIFCSEKGDFKNEIIWHYRKWSIRQQQFVSNHDVIFFYTKSDSRNRTFNQLYMDRAASTLKRFGKMKIVSGHDKTTGKRLPSDTLDEESEGVPMDDVWDIGRVPPVKQLFPTQKPTALLERIIIASSKKGDTILDAYCGCGTTIVEAERLERNWIGIDITYTSISLILKRIEESFGQKAFDKIETNGIPKAMDAAIALANKKDDRVRKEFEKWAILTYTNNRALINEKKGGDKGIDGICFVIDTSDGKKNEYKKIIFSVKSNKALTPAAVRELNGTVDREKAVMGILITLYSMENLKKESKKYGAYKSNLFTYTSPKLQVISAEDILNGDRLNIPETTLKAVIKEAEEKAKGVKKLFD